MLFDGARASIALRIELAAQSRFIGWDVICLGRTASGERFASGNLRQSLDLFRDGALVFCERAAIEGGALRSNPVQSSRARPFLVPSSPRARP